MKIAFILVVSVGMGAARTDSVTAVLFLPFLFSEYFFLISSLVSEKPDIFSPKKKKRRINATTAVVQPSDEY